MTRVSGSLLGSLPNRRPSSVAKNTLAERRISLTFSNSAIYFFSRLMSSCASEVIRASRSVSTSARFFDNRSVSGLTPRRPAT